MDLKSKLSQAKEINKATNVFLETIKRYVGPKAIVMWGVYEGDSEHARYGETGYKSTRQGTEETLTSFQLVGNFTKNELARLIYDMTSHVHKKTTYK